MITDCIVKAVGVVAIRAEEVEAVPHGNSRHSGAGRQRLVMRSVVHSVGRRSLLGVQL